jgi:2-polyprenyl-3-methyl-5-hydroxy-6-metoxy-1,4-benzoquinol methylase
MSKKNFLNYWNNMYSKTDVFGTGATILAKNAKDILQNTDVKTILEVGCGQGRDSIYFSTLGYNVDAFDVSQNAIDHVTKIKHEMNLSKLTPFVHDAKISLSKTNKMYDFIYSNLALQFFEINELDLIFKNISDLMKPSSSFLFSTKKAGDKYHNFGEKMSDVSFSYKSVTRFFYDQKILEKTLSKYFEIVLFDSLKHTNLDNSVSMWWRIQVKKI